MINFLLVTLLTLRSGVQLWDWLTIYFVDGLPNRTFRHLSFYFMLTPFTVFYCIFLLFYVDAYFSAPLRAVQRDMQRFTVFVNADPRMYFTITFFMFVFMLFLCMLLIFYKFHLVKQHMLNNIHNNFP